MFLVFQQYQRADLLLIFQVLPVAFQSGQLVW